MGSKVNRGAAWYYPQPSKAASNIKNHVVFWGGVKVEAKHGEEFSGGGLLGALKQLFGG